MLKSNCIYLLWTLLFLGAHTQTLAQNKKVDLSFISQKTNTLAHNSSHYKGYNPAKWILHGSLSFYQKVLSPQISASCLYHTSCSRFSRKALQEFGFLKGIALTADRLSRCNRVAATDLRPIRIGEDGLVIDEPFMYHIHK